MSESLDQEIMATNEYTQEQAPGNRQYPLMVLLLWWEQKIIQEAPHQRVPERWGKEKRRAYIRDLLECKSGSEPCSAFATYQLRDFSSGRGVGPMYLNDGLQRTTTLFEFAKHPERYGYTHASVTGVMMREITVMHRLFDNHRQALSSFQKLNNGTRLTAFELLHGILLYTDGFEMKWRPLIDKIDICIDGRWQLFKGRKTVDTKQEHMHKRHNLAVLYRFLTEDKEMTAYNDVRKTDIPVDALVEEAQVIEQRLATYLLRLEKEVGYDEVCRRVGLCCRWIEQASGDLVIWRDEELGSGSSLSPGLFRWILDASIWRKHNAVPVPSWEKFIRGLLRISKGDSQFRIPHPDGSDETQPITLNLTAISTIHRLAVAINVPDLIDREPRRRGRRVLVGLDSGHITPFRDAGNGPTMPQSRSVNRSKGATPIETVERVI